MAQLPVLLRQLTIARAARFVGTATLITILGFMIFESTFVGGIRDLVAALLWGFSVDVSFAKVTELALPLAPKG